MHLRAVSTDGGREFHEVALASGTLPAVSYTTSGHSQGGNKVQVDVYRPYSIYLAPNTAAAGLIHVTRDAQTGLWSAKKVSPGTTSSFQQVGMGLGLGDNSVPALYAMGVISDNTSWPVQPARYGVYRSFDNGAHWTRINDDQHQFGDLRALSGDSRVLGRVYVGTGTRGIRIGEIDWVTDKGVNDKNTLSSLRLTASTSEAVAGAPIDVTAELFDPWGESLGDVTADTVFTTTVESTVLGGTSTNPWVSLTYVIRGTYTWPDASGDSVTSAPVRVEVYNVDALVPIITGKGAVGQTLQAQVPAGWPVTFEWLRGGEPTGATGAAYPLTATDAGTTVSVKALLDKAGGVEKLSAGVSVAKIAPSVTAKLSKATIKKSAKAKVVVTVKAAGIAAPTGKVLIKYGRSTKTVTLNASHNGKITVTLPKLKKGKYSITVTFMGNAAVSAKTAKAVKLKVK